MLATYRAAQGLGEAIWLPVPMPLDGARRAPRRAGAATGLQPRHLAPARTRQRAGAQCGAGAARPRAERPGRRPGGDAAAAAPQHPGRSRPAGGARPAPGARLPLDLHRGDQRLAARALGRPRAAGPLRLRRLGRTGGAGGLVRAQPDARRPDAAASLGAALRGAERRGRRLHADRGVQRARADDRPLRAAGQEPAGARLRRRALAGRSGPPVASRPHAEARRSAGEVVRPWRPSPPLRPATRDVPA